VRHFGCEKSSANASLLFGAASKPKCGRPQSYIPGNGCKMSPISKTKKNMKTAKSIALVLVAIPLLAGSPACGQGSKEDGKTPTDGTSAVEQQIKTLHEQGREAALKGDASFLEKYLADDYVGIGSDGSLITKDQNV